MPLPIYHIYTDGSFRRPNYGSYAAIILHNDKEHACISQAVFDATINKMELLAIAAALGSFKTSAHIHIYSDSQYAINCITKWMYSWARNDWLTSIGEPVKNKDVIENIYNLCQLHEVKAYWIRGHNGNVHNEKCDKLAQDLTRAMANKTILPSNV